MQDQDKEDAIAACQPLILKAIKTLPRPRTLEYEDLIQIGRLAVLTAMRHYEPNHPSHNAQPAAFTTYAYRIIRRHMSDAINKDRGTDHRKPGVRPEIVPYDDEAGLGVVPDHANPTVMSIWLGKLMGLLEPTERTVIQRLYLDEVPARTLAQRLQVTVSELRAIERKALEKMKAASLDQ